MFFVAAVAISLLVTPPYLQKGAFAQKDGEEYPEHIQSELEADRLERETRVYKLRRELEALKGSKISLQIEKFKEVLALLETDKEIRALLKESPEMYSLYKSALGRKATIKPGEIAGDEEGILSSADRFCGCLTQTRVRWLGQKQQEGEAVLALGGALFDLKVGEKVGGTLCRLKAANAKKAVLECRDPVANKMLTETLAMQSLPSARPASKPESE